MSEVYSIGMPRKVFSGLDSILKIEEIIKMCGAKKVVLITDKGVFNAGILEKPLEVLRSLNVEINIISDVPTEPEKKQVMQIFKEANEFKADLIIAIGGGSVMDTTKLVAVLMKNEGYRENILDTSLIIENGVKTVMVPTSSGTGAEVTPNAIVIIPEEELKVGIVTDKFIGDYVILDPQMTKSLPPHITASTGIDAFCHCIECFISKKSNPISDIFALKGINLISKYIRRAYINGSDMEARENMLLAAFYGGLSISSASTVAVHALSYPLGGKYRIAHGVSNAMLLPYVMEFNANSILDKLIIVANEMDIDVAGLSKEDIGKKVISEIYLLVKDLKIPSDLTKFGITKEDIETLVDAAAKVTRLLNNNPKEMTRDDMKNIYMKLL
ncbi:iron-containing alcohol dehydrogenase [Clostridium estertheticum]|uniref:Iron-containing alcohol dehydrogenase n=1 Tax=Clostridium estertheticum TaxID=238834 RepID=A0AA47I5F9_9CLOT|nr:iron-containing alcohol dehydrogenase [Clostridium estertheticum]MBU3154975.1 iron-containing alcohol dehydrogenase [Clostridium estertheticum]WAG58795.1 iron-containing alcohol dehydrogenase [Clostridium estertheticum]